MVTQVPSIVFDNTGLVLPQEKDILEGVLADIDAAFGGGVNKQLSSPQGQLAQSLTAIIGDKNSQLLSLSNLVDPDKSNGAWQDAIGNIYLMERVAGVGTVVNAVCSGLIGAVIPANSVAQDTNGYLYYSTAEATIGASGTANVQFQNSQHGAIACPIGALSKIYVNVTGWERIENLTAGVLGNEVESRADFEYRRKNSVAANANASVNAILSNVLAVPNVIDAYVKDNPTGAAVSVGETNYSMIAHSVYVAVVGGEADAIAKAIWDKKSIGCNYNGNTSFTIIDDVNYSQPYPSYLVKWQTPTPTPTYLKVEISANPLLPADIVSLIKTAIVSAFNGSDGGQRARIGSKLVAGRFYAGIAQTNINVQILSVLLGFTAVDATHTAVTYGVDQSPSIDAANIVVTLV